MEIKDNNCLPCLHIVIHRNQKIQTYSLHKSYSIQRISDKPLLHHEIEHFKTLLQKIDVIYMY